jgi:hypothetical protein
MSSCISMITVNIFSFKAHKGEPHKERDGTHPTTKGKRTRNQQHRPDKQDQKQMFTVFRRLDAFCMED